MKQLKIGDVVEYGNGYKEKVTNRHLTARTRILNGRTLEEYNDEVLRKTNKKEYMVRHFGESVYADSIDALMKLETLLAVDTDYLLKDREELEIGVAALRDLLE